MAVYKDDSNLQGLWLLEETSGTRYDYTDNDNDLSDNNTVGYSSDSKEGDNSADFERNNDESLSITDAAQTGLDITGDFSVVAWIKLESTPGEMAIVAKYTWSSPDRSYEFAVTGAGKVILRLSPDGGSANMKTATGDTALSTGTWYHVGAVYDGTDMRIYVYGSLDANGDNPYTYSSGIYDGSADFRLGRTDDSYAFDGLMDEVGVFDRALSASEVSDIYTNGIQDPTGAAGPLVNSIPLKSLVHGGLT